jgi:translation initiation factor 5B
MGKRQLLIWGECKSPLFLFYVHCEQADTDKGNRTSIERDHKQIQVCKKGQPSVAVKIEGPNQPMYGRHLEEKETLYSHISRQSIDTLKEFFREDVSMDEWKLISKLKPVFDVA